ncbi:helix-turn-helix transcriptional regulator [Comamonas sp. NoAH]|uniref:helix-turn-helix transcriptional regulator n=1 Tax=Comamonas halotolerans TaxID=3041496 RepID=UPI0024E0F434|nr:helix-turn-helix transcriptional regulator [Comamonas sp. NoAH]
MMESAFAHMGFSGYTPSKMACVLKDIPVLNTKAATRAASPTQISVEKFSEITHLLYDAASEPEAWTPCLEAIRQQMKANFASLIIRHNSSNSEGLILSASDDIRGLAHYDSFCHESPFHGIPTDHFVTITDMMTESDWRANKYYNQWCKIYDVYHVLAVDIVTKDGSVYGLRITRPETAAAFGQAEKELGRMLLPHLKRALNMHLELNRDRQVISTYSKATAQLMVGVVILDQNGVVIEINPAAAAILDMGDGIKVSNHYLEATYANDNRKLQRLIKDALAHSQTLGMCMTEAMSVNRPSGQLNWGVVVQSISADEWTEGKQRPSAAVFMRDTDGKADPSVRLAQQLFQLTPAETSLAIRLANGLSLEEAAEVLNIRRNTARAHLRSIFSKTGVRRQTELVRIFLNSVAWLGSK